MECTFKLEKEDNLYLQEFINELLKVYDNVTISVDDKYYYISLNTHVTIEINKDYIKYDRII